jgi:hypothetical protein
MALKQTDQIYNGSIERAKAAIEENGFDKSTAVVYATNLPQYLYPQLGTADEDTTERHHALSPERGLRCSEMISRILGYDVIIHMNIWSTMLALKKAEDITIIKLAFPDMFLAHPIDWNTPLREDTGGDEIPF